MVTKDDKEGVLIKGVDDVLKDVVHLLLFREHRGVVRTDAVPNMVDAEEMADKEIPLRGVGEKREEVGDDAVVDCVQILDVEGIKVMGHFRVERGRKDGEPGVISHERYLHKKFDESPTVRALRTYRFVSPL